MGEDPTRIRREIERTRDDMGETVEAIGYKADLRFLIGTLLPSSRVEDEKVGPLADDVKSQLKETGEEAFERGKEAAREAVEGVESALPGG